MCKVRYFRRVKWLEQRSHKMLPFAKLIFKVILPRRVREVVASRIYAHTVRGYWETRGKTYFEEEKHLLGPAGSVGKRAHFIANEIRKLAPKTVLEVGCGYGAILKPLAEDLQLDLLVGCDFSSTQLRKAREYLDDKGVSLVYADAKLLPFPDNSFDLVFTSGVIMHLPSPQDIKAREEIIRVSRKHIIHNESLTRAFHMFGHDNEQFYRKRGYTIVTSRVNSYRADRNMQFIIVRLK